MVSLLVGQSSDDLLEERERFVDVESFTLNTPCRLCVGGVCVGGGDVTVDANM